MIYEWDGTVIDTHLITGWSFVDDDVRSDMESDEYTVHMIRVALAHEDFSIHIDPPSLRGCMVKQPPEIYTLEYHQGLGESEDYYWFYNWLLEFKHSLLVDFSMENPSVVREGTTITLSDIDLYSSKQLLETAKLLLLDYDDELPDTTKAAIKTFCKNQFAEVYDNQHLDESDSSVRDGGDSSPNPLLDAPPSQWDMHQMNDKDLIDLLAKLVHKRFISTEFKHQLVNFISENRYSLMNDWKATCWALFQDGKSIREIKDICGLSDYQVEDAIREGSQMPF